MAKWNRLQQLLFVSALLLASIDAHTSPSPSSARSFAESLETLMMTYAGSKMGYANQDSDFSSKLVILGLAIALPLILMTLPMLIGPFLALFGLNMFGNNSAVPTVASPILGKRRKREVPRMERVETVGGNDAMNLLVNIGRAIHMYGNLDKNCKKNVICKVHQSRRLRNVTSPLADALLNFLRHSNVSSLLERYLDGDEYNSAVILGARSTDCDLAYRQCKDRIMTDDFLRTFFNISK